MTLSLQTLVEHYGYLAMFVGTFLEGETILILGGFLAHRGYLDVEWVIASAFIGTYSGDQLFFYIGRWRGGSMLEKRPHWQLRSKRVFQLLDRHQVMVILGFRFLYGIRTVTPFLIGMSGISPLRYLVLNGVGALIWSIAVGLLGFLLGETVQLIIHHIRHYEIWVLCLITILAIGYWLYRWICEQKQINRDRGARGSCQD